VSVTFSVEALPTGQVAFDCFFATYGPFDGLEAGQVALATHVETCEECDLYRPALRPVMDVEASVNMANANAAMLMGILGLEVGEELCGSVDADTLLASALLALAEDRDSAPVADAVEKISGGPTIVHCGLPQDYTDMRLRAIADIATEAKRLGRTIVWS
jgi:hypothetical protein